MHLLQSLISYFKYVQELKEIMSKELKRNMRTMPHQIISVEIDYLKKQKSLELKSVITEMKNSLQ